jgi:hypothetical protein
MEWNDESSFGWLGTVANTAKLHLITLNYDTLSSSLIHFISNCVFCFIVHFFSSFELALCVLLGLIIHSLHQWPFITLVPRSTPRCLFYFNEFSKGCQNSIDEENNDRSTLKHHQTANSIVAEPARYPHLLLSNTKHQTRRHSSLGFLPTMGKPFLPFHGLLTRSPLTLIRPRLLKHSLTSMRQLHHDLVAEQTVDLLERKPLGLRTTVPNRRHKHHGHDDEDEVIPPPNLRDSERETLKIRDRRQHEDGDAEAHAFGAQVGREDLGAVDVDCRVDEAGEAGSKSMLANDLWGRRQLGGWWFSYVVM